MKGIVVHFSQTGNTRQIAQAIQTGMKQVMGECDIAAIKEVNAQDLAKYDLIGLGAPIWRLSVPANVMAFIQSLPSLEGKHSFPFCSHGALPVGFMKIITTALMRKGLTIIGYNDWYGGAFLPYLPKPYVTDGHPDEIDLKEAEDFGREMAERSRRIYSGETNLIPKLPEETSDDSLWRIEASPAGDVIKIRQTTREQRVINIEKCKYPGCTLCMDNCPMDSIDFSVSPPVFKSNCQVDWFCEAICPEGAIEVDFGPLTKAHDFVVSGVFVRLLDEAEAKGTFRRYVPLEKVGWNTHQHEITGHPRYVIPE
ncbi:EFR1 family ferrodoxin [Chloroflexota bacterium]